MIAVYPSTNCDALPMNSYVINSFQVSVVFLWAFIFVKSIVAFKHIHVYNDNHRIVLYHFFMLSERIERLKV